MGHSIIQNIYTTVRNSFFNIVNKEFLIFLFFLALSGAFWLMLALNDTYEKEVKIPVRIVNIPKNVVVTSDIDDTLRVVLRDKGYALCTYLYGDGIKRVNLPFGSYIKKKGYGVVSYSELSKVINLNIYSSSRIVSIKPEKFEYFYNYGMYKRMPVKLFGNIVPSASYYLAKVEFSPSMVDVYGSQQMLDSIKCIYTERLNIRNLKDTIVRDLDLMDIKGVKCVPSRVRISVYPDVLTEENVEVPIVAANMPEGKVLRTFPSRVKVIFTVGASIFRTITPDKFKVVVDYNEIVDNPSEKCTLKVVSVPHGIRNAHPEVSQVDYLIEEQ